MEGAGKISILDYDTEEDLASMGLFEGGDANLFFETLMAEKLTTHIVTGGGVDDGAGKRKMPCMWGETHMICIWYRYMWVA